MIRPALLLLLPLLLTVACAPLIELEDENIALRSKVDSLEIVLAECRGQGELLGDRLAAIEAQNLALDDRNRELTATLAETQYRGSDVEDGQTIPEEDSTVAATPEKTDIGNNPPAAEALPVRPRETETTDHGGVAVLSRFEAGRPAGLGFLRRYQEALNAYNEKRFRDAARLFGELLAERENNDMIDNCLYWLGEAEAQLGHRDEAIGYFTRTVGCSGGDKVDDALFSRASARRDAGDHGAARADLQLLLKDHPQSELAGQARRMLQGLQ